MVRLDHCRFTAQTTFYNVRINGSLCQEINGTDLLCFFFKNTDEFFTDNLTFCFRLCYSGKFVIISLLCINTDESSDRTVLSVRIQLLPHRLHLYEADRDLRIHRSAVFRLLWKGVLLPQKNLHHRIMHRSTLSVADFFTDIFDRILYKCIHLPVTGTSTDIHIQS